MAFALALPALLSASLAAGPALELGVRSEGRASTLSLQGAAATTRTSGAVAPGAAAFLDAAAVRASMAYLARFWSSEFEAGLDLLVTQTLDARVEIGPNHPWRVQLTASGEEGTTDPLSDPLQLIHLGGPYVAAPAGSEKYRSLRGGARAELELGQRTRLTTGATASTSEATTAAGRTRLPPQRIAFGDLSLAHRVTELDTLRVNATTEATWTDAAAGQARALSTTAAAAWRRRLTPRVEAWIEAGSGFRSTNGGPSEILPVGETGVSLASTSGRPGGSLSARFTTYVDRVTGSLVPIAEGRLLTVWPVANAVEVTASIAGRQRTDGLSSLGFADAWVRWAVRPRLSVDAGLAGRWQREHVPGVPYYSEAAVMLAITYRTVRL